MFKKSCAIIGTKLRKSTEEDNDYEIEYGTGYGNYDGSSIPYRMRWFRYRIHYRS